MCRSSKLSNLASVIYWHYGSPFFTDFLGRTPCPRRSFRLLSHFSGPLAFVSASRHSRWLSWPCYWPYQMGPSGYFWPKWRLLRPSRQEFSGRLAWWFAGLFVHATCTISWKLKWRWGWGEVWRWCFGHGYARRLWSFQYDPYGRCLGHYECPDFGLSE